MLHVLSKPAHLAMPTLSAGIPTSHTESGYLGCHTKDHESQVPVGPGMETNTHVKTCGREASQMRNSFYSRHGVSRTVWIESRVWHEDTYVINLRARTYLTFHVTSLSDLGSPAHCFLFLVINGVFVHQAPVSLSGSRCLFLMNYWR